jgi:CPA2 family monovalent cation:H+ antiporter-2
VGLAQFGEFGFVLARLAQESGVVSAADLQPLLAAGIGSMFLTPLLVRVAPHITAGERLLAPLERLIGVRSIDQADQGPVALRGHVVIVGYGVAGRLAGQALTACGTPYVVLELNADTVRNAKNQGLPLYYGDATSTEALRHAHLADARLCVLLINDPQGAARVVDSARRVAPHVPLLMRARFLTEGPALLRLGASEVVSEEVEGAVEIIARMLTGLGASNELVTQRIAAVRAQTKGEDPTTSLRAARA